MPSLRARRRMPSMASKSPMAPMPLTSPIPWVPSARGVGLPLLLLLGLLLAPSAASAESSLVVRADKESIQLGETLGLRIRASTDVGGGQQRIELAAPSLDDWAIVGQSESQRVDGFRGTRTTTITLTLQPRRAGTLTIGEFTLKVPGDPIRSAPITVKVRDGGVAAPGAPAAPGQAGASPGEAAPDEVVFLRWEVDRDTAWLGQQLDARLYVYTREGITIREFKLGEIDLSGFWNEQHGQHRRARGRDVVVGGLRFDRQEVAHYSLFPLRVGEQPLPAVTAEMTVGRVGLFGGPRSIVNRAAAEVPITVRPLPVEGRPPGFSGPTVGPTRLTASVDRQQIDAGEGVQLTVITRLDGLIQNAPPVALPALPDFKVFPAGDDTRTDWRDGDMLGVRRQSWLLRPQRGGALQIPALALPYFDPSTGEYGVARTGPIAIRVQGEPGAAPEEAAPAAEDGPALRDIRADVDLDAGPRDGLGLWFPAALFGAPLLFGFGWLAERVRHRRHATAGSRAARTAARDARAKLDRIGRKGDDPRAGYSAVARAVVDYLETRFGAPFNGLTREATRAALVQRGVGPATADALLEELDACDFARFAPAADAASGLPETARRAAEVIAAVEREAAA